MVNPLREIEAKLENELNEMYGLMVSTASGDEPFLERITRDVEDNQLYEIAVGTNLQDSISTLAGLIFAFLDYKPSASSRYSMKTIWGPISMQLHVVCQEMYDVLYMAGLNHQTIELEFPVLFRVKRLANFLKHPKTRLLLHNPKYIYISYEYKPTFVQGIIEKMKQHTPLLSEQEIKNYYSREDKNKDRDFEQKYANKEDVLIVLPSVANLCAETLDALMKLNHLISSNPVLYNSIKKKSARSLGDIDDMVESYYELLSDIERGK